MFALYYLSQAVQEFKHKHRGTTIVGVTKKQLRCLPFPLAPLPEQDYIVSSINFLQGRLREVAELELKTEKELQELIPSVLDKAFNGEL
jgi:type I restriction enzyme S subunit